MLNQIEGQHLTDFIEKYKPDEKVLGILRIAMGFVFLWPFLDKLFGLGFATAPENSWLAGASPTQGFLQFYGVNQNSPFAFIFADGLGSMYQLVDIAYMGMLLFAGLGLMTGILVRLSSISTIIFMVSIYLSEWIINPAAGSMVFNPLIDEHIIYILILGLFLIVPVGNYLGLGKKWSEISFVQKFPILR
jgi:thiosulfate dehydrogenase [quinone] large subunit